MSAIQQIKQFASTPDAITEDFLAELAKDQRKEAQKIYRRIIKTKNELKRLDNLFAYEDKLREKGYSLIAGVDGVGIGSLAGPVYTCAVVLPKKVNIIGLNDSKKLTPKTREKLAMKIKEIALDYAIGIATVEEIQQLNVRRAELLAMKRAVESLHQPPDYVLVDGRDRIMPLDIPQEAIVRGDQLIASISAASILAKTARDKLMDEYDSQYPVYGFSKHKGYGTTEHINALDEYGPSPIHRIYYRPVAVAKNKMETVQLALF
jgi:ribonuclease HII